MRKMFGLGELDTAMRGTLINNILLVNGQDIRALKLADLRESKTAYTHFLLVVSCLGPMHRTPCCR